MLAFLPKDPHILVVYLVAVSVASAWGLLVLYLAYQRLAAFDWRFNEDGTLFGYSLTHLLTHLPPTHSLT